MNQPLASVLRPKNLDDFVGQTHLVGEGKPLRLAIQNHQIFSMIFWGPPGVGKTTLAKIIAHESNADLYELSAVSASKDDIKKIIGNGEHGLVKKILFLDEIHRFNKSQQDSLLGAVEKGIITLIGATTENPSFEVISPLLSRCQVYILKDLDKQNLLELLERGKNHLSQKLNLKIEITENEALLRVSGGDARKLLNALELVTNAFSAKDKTVIIDNDKVQNVIQKNLAIYDKSGEMHYDIISAFIKSMRGSDPNAAVYWLARMVEAGEDPLFIARRMLILASEDIGNANPNALLLAQTCFEAVNVIGYPECRIILSQTAVYLASSPKSNASYMAIKNAQETVNSTGDLPVPLYLRNAPTRLMKEIGYGDGYRYAHDFQNNFTDLEFLPDNIRGKKFYDPGNNPKEKEIRARLKQLWKEKYKY